MAKKKNERNLQTLTLIDIAAEHRVWRHERYSGDAVV